MKSIASAIRMCGSIVIASGIKVIFSKLCSVMGSPSSKIEPPLIGVNFIIAFKIVVFPRSEEHTSELQSRFDLVCRLLLEKKKKEGHGAKMIGLAKKRQSHRTAEHV